MILLFSYLASNFKTFSHSNNPNGQSLTKTHYSLKAVEKTGSAEGRGKATEAEAGGGEDSLKKDRGNKARRKVVEKAAAEKVVKQKVVAKWVAIRRAILDKSQQRMEARRTGLLGAGTASIVLLSVFKFIESTNAETAECLIYD